MELKDKLKQLRNEKNWTQEELAQKLFVSRTAISKWESGRGFPSIDSLKAISQVFSVSIDDLLSNKELISLAENDQKEQRAKAQQQFFGLLDCFALILLFLPIFGQQGAEKIQFVSLLALNFSTTIKVVCIFLVLFLVIFGILEIVFPPQKTPNWLRNQPLFSLLLTFMGTLLFIMTRQPYAASFLLLILVMKGISLINKH